MNVQSNYKVYHEVASENFPMLPSLAGIIPDIASDTPIKAKTYICAFKDEMPQNIITRVVQFHLNAIALNGNESPTLIKNLRLTLTPDIVPNLQIWKTATVSQIQSYEDCVDAFIIDMSEIDEYKGKQPFLITGITATDHMDSLFHKYKSQCIGFVMKD